MAGREEPSSVGDVERFEVEARRRSSSSRGPRWLRPAMSGALIVLIALVVVPMLPSGEGERKEAQRAAAAAVQRVVNSSNDHPFAGWALHIEPAGSAPGPPMIVIEATPITPDDAPAIPDRDTLRASLEPALVHAEVRVDFAPGAGRGGTTFVFTLIPSE